MRLITIIFLFWASTFSHAKENDLKIQPKIIQVNPFYGWGWSDYKSKKIIELPISFTAKLESILECEGKYKGGIAKVLTTAHPLTNKWFLFSKRHIAQANLKEKGYHYNVSVFENKPDKNINFCENKSFKGTTIFGYAELFYK